MRILHIIDSGGLYGAEVMLLNLLEQQCQQGITPVLVSIGDTHCGEKAIEFEARKRKIPVKTFRMRNGVNVLGAWAILRYAQSIKCDLLHSHGYKGNILFGFLPKIIRKFPLMTTIHGWTSTSSPFFSRMRLYEWIDAQTLRHMDAIVLVNKLMLDHVKISKGKFKNISIINNGISTQTPKMVPCRRKKSDDSVKILAVGRLSPEKGFDLLIDAIAKLVETGCDVSVVIYGEGGERSKLESKVQQYSLQERILLPGFMENAASHFPCFDMLVMPSLTEGLPITLLEAMRARLAVVATRVGGIPNVLENEKTGLLVESGSVKELVAAMGRMVNERELRMEIAQKAALVFEKEYSAKQMADAYQRLYSKLLDSVIQK